MSFFCAFVSCPERGVCFCPVLLADIFRGCSRFCVSVAAFFFACSAFSGLRSALRRGQVCPPGGSGPPPWRGRCARFPSPVLPFPRACLAVLLRGSFSSLYYIIRCLPFPSLVPSAVLPVSSIRCIAAVYVLHPEIFSKKSPICFARFPQACTFAPAFGNGGGDV